MKRLLFVLVLLVVAAACGSSTPKSGGAPAVAWKDMNADQRLEFMKTVVMPKAKVAFQKFDAKKYADMDCGTCHGDGADDGSFEMPNAKIKALPATEEAYMAWIEKDAEAKRYTDFMSGELVPMMADLLGEKAYDPKTNTGEFSCPECHTMAGEKK